MTKKQTGWKVTFKVFTAAVTLMLAAHCGLTGYAGQVPISTELTFGALLDITGDWSSLGESSQKALDMAVRDVNDYLSRIQSRIRVNLIVEDTGGKPLAALGKLEGLVERGVRVLIGPQSSAEVKAIKAYTDENGVLVISQSSTAHSLAIREDSIFRFCPDDISESQLITSLMWEDGVRVLVPIWRDDAGNRGLYVAVKDSFEMLGGTVLDGVSYSPTTKDFSEKLGLLSTKVDESTARYGTSAVGVYLAAFNEAASIFNQASLRPTLSHIRWYGANGVTLSNALVNSSQAARFAMASDFVSPIFGLDERARDRWEPVAGQIKALIGRDPDAFTLAAYDALWVATLASLAVGDTEDFVALREALVETAHFYFGTTGWTVLNEAGDRKFATYDFWAVKENNGIFRWEQVARY